MKAWILSILILISIPSFAQRAGSIRGVIEDASSGEVLPYANAALRETSLGATTEENGSFSIPSVPPGEYTLVLSYVGYQEKEIEVSVSSGSVTDIGTVSLDFEAIMGEEVVVTMQLRGQAQAINKQVNSNRIVNAVSAERIREIPDRNAAESVGRLPGISIQRNSGEGSRIAVRGVDPRFNSITLNGQKISPAGGSDRSVDLSMISSDALGGIEVYKSITPDQDGDAIGGSVNILTKKADEGFQVRALAEAGYNNLVGGIGSKKGVLTVSNRFLDNKLGLIVSGTAFDANRDVDRLSIDYDASQSDSDGNPIVIVSNVNLQDRDERRVRYSATATSDYQFDNGEIVFDYFYARMDRDVMNRGIRYREPVLNVNYEFNASETTTQMHNVGLRGNHDLGFMEISYSGTFSSNRDETPLGYGSGFDETGGLDVSELSNDPTPEEIVAVAYHNLDNALGGGIGYSNNLTTDRNASGQIDLTFPFRLGGAVSGYFKMGGKIRYKERVRDNNSYGFKDFIDFQRAYIRDNPDGRYLGNNLLIWNYLDRDFEPLELQTGFTLEHAMDPEIIYNTLMFYKDSARLWAPNYAGDFLNDYDAQERISAGYAMMEINLGKRVMFLPGIRIEQTYNTYNGLSGFVDFRGGRQVPFIEDTSATKTILDILPMFQLRYQMFDFLTIRGSVTKTLGRPNFFNLAPFTYIDKTKERTIIRGSTDLLNTTSWNYDAQVTYFSRFGLLSAGVFYKSLSNIDVDFETKNLEVPFSDPYFGFSIRNPINLDYETTIQGFEIELQSNLRYLPSPLDGIVLTANYSRIYSETFFPFFSVQYPPPDYTAVVVDTARAGRVPGQSAQTFNITLGYEKGGFSGRVTYAYQGDLLSSVSTSKELDVYQDTYERWEAVLTQKVFKDFTILANLINISNSPERSYQGVVSNLRRIEYFGWQFSLGIRYDLSPQ